MKHVRHVDRDFTIQGVASAYESGYEVAFDDGDGKRGRVQLRVLLNSAMNLVAIPDRVFGRVAVAVACRAPHRDPLESPHPARSRAGLLSAPRRGACRVISCSSAYRW